MSGILDGLGERLRRALGRILGAGEDESQPGKRVSNEDAWAFVQGVMERRHFTPEARDWLRRNVKLRLDDLESTRGGGYWMPSSREVRLFTAQDEAAVHELAHAWWHDRRHGREDEMIEATARLSVEEARQYAVMANLARGYMHGLPEQGFEGFLKSRNDWEMFAGLASGSMGEVRLLPPYVQKLYEGLFEM